ncbi:amino acid adenylation domain-containing protein [Rhodococcus sp. SORGH_AS_0303]|uniref:amino acid adenylation domain-containing protein n=1 Tax=Rhodococcus sp. SORGH_AS_0303 TaxID=3041753 RepID=UPI0027824066|nr:amino acid adenylation domain-containing protein [Rhodococcus sp. SORGH_AS_0303]MDQ1203039.1 amino acid adenylation domain-containing protein [Rhodococcus sp. SORGH_AS_0303]
MTSAQAAVWYAQHVTPDLPFTIAYCVEITGDLDVDALRLSSTTALAEYRSSTLRVRDIDGRPCQTFVEATPDVDVRDLRELDDAADAARHAMRSACDDLLPFDGPLVTSTVFRVQDDRVLWFTRAHHIAQDGHTSMLVLARTADLYAASVHGKAVPPIDIPTPEMLLDEDARFRASARSTRDETFWAELDAVSARSAVRLGRVHRPRPVSVRTGPGSAVPTDTPEAAGPSTSYATTATMIAAFAVLLCHMTGARDIRLSLPISVRADAISRRAGSTMSAVAPLVLTGIGDGTVGDAIALTEKSLSAVLRRSRTAVTARRVAAAGAPGHESFGPTVNIMMFAEDLPIGDLCGTLEILTTGPVPDLAVNIHPAVSGGAPRVDIEGNPAAHTAADLDRLRRRYLRLSAEFTRPETSDTLVSALDIRLPGEMDSAPASVGPTASVPTTLADVFDAAVLHHGNSPAITGDGRVVTYAELATHVDALARILRERGLGPEDPVAVRVPRSVEAVVAFWAVIRVGAAYVPIDPDLPVARARFLLEDSRATTALGDAGPHVGNGVGPVWIPLVDRAATPRSGALVGSIRRDPRTAAYIIYTSGSTGAPKGVVVTHSGIGSLVDHIRSHYGLDTSSRVCLSAAPGFDTAVVELLAAAATGCALAVAPPNVFGGPELTDFAVRAGVTHLFVTPSALATLDIDRAGSIGTVIVGGEDARDDLMTRWCSGRVLLDAYGPTETTCSVTMTGPLADGDPSGIGRAMTGVRIHLLDAQLRPVTPGAIGEIYIEAAGLARGYLGRSAMTSARFVADPFSPDSRLFRSGDLARCLVDGTLEYHGRTDDQVQIRGNRVELGEMESAMRRHTAVSAAAVRVGRRSDGTARLDGYLVPVGAGVDVDDMRRFLSRSLPAHMIPSTITVVEAMPLTANRKVNREALPEPEVPVSSTSAPSGAMQTLVARAFCEVLESTTVDVALSFFDMGGDSLAATRVVSRLRTATGTDVGVRDIVDAPTVRALAAVLDSRVSGSPEERVTRAREGLANAAHGVPLAPQQRDIDRDSPLPLYNLPFTLDITGPFDVDAASRAFDDLIERHPTLRTTYPDSPDGPRQVVERDPEPVTIDALPFTETTMRDILAAPFDVRYRRPFRVAILHVAPDHAVLACVVHHIAADGWSLGILAADFTIAYRARTRGRSPDLVSIPLSYGDYSVWAAARPTSGDLSFWADELRGACFTATLPAGRPLPCVWSYTAARDTTHVDSETVRHIDAVARQCGVGRFTVLRTALLVALSRATGAEDIVVGTPVAERNDPALEQIVGTFTTTVPVRTDLTSTFSMSDVVRSAHASETRALDHTSVPLHAIAAQLDPGPHPLRHPLFQIALSYDVMQADVVTLDTTPDGTPTRATVEPRPLDTAKCDLHVHVVEHRESPGDRLEVAIVYPTAVYDAPTIEDFGRELARALQDLIDEPGASWRRETMVDRRTDQLLHDL